MSFLLNSLLASAIVVTGAPQHVASNGTASAVSTSPSVNYPSSIQANDVAILVLTYSSAAGSPTFADPSGYTAIQTQTATTGNLTRKTAWWHRCNGSESGTVAISVSGSTLLTGWTAELLIYRGCVSSGTPVEGAGAAWASGYTLGALPSAIRNIASPDRTIVHSYSVDNSSGSAPTITAGSGFTTRRTASVGAVFATSVHDKQRTVPGYQNEVAELSTVITTSYICVYFSLVPQTVVSSSTPDTVDSNLASNVLLLGCNGANAATNMIDEMVSATTLRVLSAVGNAKVSTAVTKFGSGTLAFDGTSDWFSAADSADWDFSSSPFTVEGWFRFLVKQSSQAMLGQWDNSGTTANCAWFFYITGGNLTLRLSNGSSLVDVAVAFAPTLGQWYHLAATRDGTGKTRIFRDGVMVASGTTQNFAPPNSTASLVIGAIGTGSAFSSFDFNGNMDEIRVTKGVARYASDAGFTALTAAFPRN